MITDRELVERFILAHCECCPQAAMEWPEDTLQPLISNTDLMIASRADRATGERTGISHKADRLVVLSKPKAMGWRW